MDRRELLSRIGATGLLVGAAGISREPLPSEDAQRAQALAQRVELLEAVVERLVTSVTPMSSVSDFPVVCREDWTAPPGFAAFVAYGTTLASATSF